MPWQVRNVALGIVSRRIQWEQLTTLETVDGILQLKLSTLRCWHAYVSFCRRYFKFKTFCAWNSITNILGKASEYCTCHLDILFIYLQLYTCHFILN